MVNGKDLEKSAICLGGYLQTGGAAWLGSN